MDCTKKKHLSVLTIKLWSSFLVGGEGPPSQQRPHLVSSEYSPMPRQLVLLCHRKSVCVRVGGEDNAAAMAISFLHRQQLHQNGIHQQPLSFSFLDAHYHPLHTHIHAHALHTTHTYTHAYTHACTHIHTHNTTHIHTYQCSLSFLRVRVLHCRELWICIDLNSAENTQMTSHPKYSRHHNTMTTLMTTLMGSLKNNNKHEHFSKGVNYIIFSKHEK